MTHVSIVYHSGYGHTALLAQAVEKGAASVEGVEVSLLTAEEAIDQLEQLKQADAIIFGAPTYMGGASAPMKAFIDASSKVWMQRGWVNKIAGGFTNSGSLSGDKLVTLTQFMVLAMQHGMIWVGNGETNQTQDPAYEGPHAQAINRIGGYIGPMAQSENAAPGPDNPPQGDVKTFELYGRRVAEAAVRWTAGQV